MREAALSTLTASNELVSSMLAEPPPIGDPGYRIESQTPSPFAAATPLW